MDTRTHRRTDGQTHRHPEGHTDGHTDTTMDTPTDTRTDTLTHGHTDGHTDTPTDTWTDTRTHGRTHAHTDGRTDARSSQARTHRRRSLAPGPGQLCGRLQPAPSPAAPGAVPTKLPVPVAVPLPVPVPVPVPPLCPQREAAAADLRQSPPRFRHRRNRRHRGHRWRCCHLPGKPVPMPDCSFGEEISNLQPEAPRRNLRPCPLVLSPGTGKKRPTPQLSTASFRGTCFSCPSSCAIPAPGAGAETLPISHLHRCHQVSYLLTGSRKRLPHPASCFLLLPCPLKNVGERAVNM